MSRSSCSTGENPAEALVRADNLLVNLRTHFDDALVVGWEPLEGSHGLPDVNDEHVVAAAVVGGAGAIVTENLRHFPADRVPANIQVLPAKEFAANTADVSPERAARAICQMSARRTRQSPQEIVELLVSRYSMDEVAEIVLPVLDEVASRL